VTKSENVGASWHQGFFLKVKPWYMVKFFALSTLDVILREIFAFKNYKISAWQNDEPINSL